MTRAFRLGLFIVATLLILAAGVFIIGNNQLRFQPTYRVKADFQNVEGLSEGSDVRVGGIHKGTVKRIDLPRQPDGKVTVVMDLQTATRGIVKKDSTAAIKSEGLLGDKYVEVSFGSKDAQRLADGDTIGSEPPMDISDLIKKTDQILDTAQGAVQNVEGAAGNLKSISSKVDQGKGTVGALVNDNKLYNQVNAGAIAFQEDMEALKHNFFLRGFFNKRGYEDSTELTKHLIDRLPAAPPAKTFVYDAKKIFDRPDTAKLKNEKVLNESGKFLEANPFGEAVIEASMGLEGDSEKDRMLAEARAMVVREYLVNNFRLDDTRIKTFPVGKSEDGVQVKIIVYPAVQGPSDRVSAKR
jgi:phospholipid/cholesterol/gamma-HCH transport system substrate-binding protein